MSKQRAVFCCVLLEGISLRLVGRNTLFEVRGRVNAMQRTEVGLPESFGLGSSRPNSKNLISDMVQRVTGFSLNKFGDIA